MPVTKQNTGRVVAAPARCKRYNIPDSEMKEFGLRVEPPGQDGGDHKAWYVQAMAGAPLKSWVLRFIQALRLLVLRAMGGI